MTTIEALDISGPTPSPSMRAIEYGRCPAFSGRRCCLANFFFVSFY
jgi:hypothetical protein